MKYGSRVRELGPKARTGRVTGFAPNGHARVQFDTGQYRIMAQWRLEVTDLSPSERALARFEEACRDLAGSKGYVQELYDNWTYTAQEAQRLGVFPEARAIFLQYHPQ